MAFLTKATADRALCHDQQTFFSMMRRLTVSVSRDFREKTNEKI